MDWLIDRRDPDTIERALSELDDHLRRHAVFDTGVDEGVDTVRAMVRGHDGDGSGELLRLRLDWWTERPHLALCQVSDPDAAAQIGVSVGSAVSARHRRTLDGASGGRLGEVTLDVDRRVQDTFADGPPPMPTTKVDPRRDGVAGAAVALSSATRAHPAAGPRQVASLAGAALADAAIDEDPQDTAHAARLILEAHESLGSTGTVLTSDDQTVELVLSGCPFGPGIKESPELCHISTGIAGRFGARLHGTSTVVLAKSIAAGDAECHLKMWLGDPEEEVRGELHRWPPTAGSATGVAPHLDLSVSLPSESGSVPVVRRLAGQALRAFGVSDEDIDDVQLAIGEACANVIDHATESDTYEVQVELASDRCSITVVDQGGGFDATAVPDEAEETAETGRGLTLMRSLTDNVAFRNEPQAGTVVHMVKNLNYDSEHPLWRESTNGAG